MERLMKTLPLIIQLHLEVITIMLLAMAFVIQSQKLLDLQILQLPLLLIMCQSMDLALPTQVEVLRSMRKEETI